MDLHITQDEFVRAMASVQGVVERRSTHQVLSNALLTAAAGELQVMATDSELTLVSRHVAQVSREGMASIHAAHLFQVARNLPTGPVHLVLENQHLVVDAPPAHYRILGLPPEDYPAFPAIEAVSKLEVGSEGLKRLVDETVFAIPLDDQRYGLNGGHLESVESPDGESRVRLVTTDGSRLCYSETPYSGTFGMGRHMLLPRKALVELRKMLDRPEEKVEIAFGERAATFTMGTAILHTRLVDGEFPAYRSVLPKTHLRRLEVDRIALLEAFRRVSLEAVDQSNTVRIQVQPEQLLISARSVDHGEANHPVPITLEGEPILMGFNVRFFLDVVSCMTDEALVAELGEALSPCVVRPRDRDDALFIVMPIRLE
ncbi:MAG: DNA polymerase III subunit beta [Deltaproteobacteria bacterium]|nr:DNA polymerase III subunit beta [Deltaproteobacteria bacterium]